MRAAYLRERQGRRGEGQATRERDMDIIDLHFNKGLSYGCIETERPQYKHQLITRVCAKERKRRHEEQQEQALQGRLDALRDQIPPALLKILFDHLRDEGLEGLID